MPGDFPKLTKPQMARLVEIGTTGHTAFALKPTLSAQLLHMQVVRKFQFWAPREHLEPSDLGIRILAGISGNEFDRFRDALAKEPTP